MPTYLLTWNPKSHMWPWLWQGKNYDQCRAMLQRKEPLTMNWEWNSELAQPGERAYIMRLGVEPMGIVGVGTLTSSPFEVADDAAERKGQPRMAVKVEIEVLTDFKRGELVRYSELPGGRWAWMPTRSGLSIRPEHLAVLEQRWHALLARRRH